jgi:hypothetical protein
MENAAPGLPMVTWRAVVTLPRTTDQDVELTTTKKHMVLPVERLRRGPGLHMVWFLVWDIM